MQRRNGLEAGGKREDEAVGDLCVETETRDKKRREENE